MRNSNFEQAKFNPELWILKKDHEWTLFLPPEDSDQDPAFSIGKICLGTGGRLKQCLNLGWSIHMKHRGQGIMKQFLKEYLSEVNPNRDNGFACVINKENIASYKAAIYAGFQIYGESDYRYYMQYKK